jgi:hypothetical protein
VKTQQRIICQSRHFDLVCSLGPQPFKVKLLGLFSGVVHSAEHVLFHAAGI